MNNTNEIKNNKPDEIEELKVEDFKPLPFYRDIFLKKEELREYYIKKRNYQYINGEHLSGKKIRDVLHPILWGLMALSRKYMNKQTLTILKDERKKTSKPVIYAITHVGMYDVQLVSEAIKKHQYTFMGDPETMYRTFDGFIMNLNGVVYCDLDDKGEKIEKDGKQVVIRENDKKIAKQVAVDQLKNGNNLMFYPEGVWNLSANLPMLPLFPGIIDIALETGCEIIPVAIEQYDRDFIVNIGKNIDVNPDKIDFDVLEDEALNKISPEEKRKKLEERRKKHIEEQKELLRDTMATLKWQIFESHPEQQREKYGSFESEYRKYVDTRYNEWVDKKTKKPFYNDGIVKKRTFKPRNITYAEEAFEHLGKMKLNKNNAFLFRSYQADGPAIENSFKGRVR